MIEYYNKYFNIISENDSYNSEIAFINTNNTCIFKESAYVEYIENNTLKYGIFKMTDELKKIYFEFRNNPDFIHKIIKKIQISTNNYSYIKILKDNINPQLEGKIMIFKFKHKISETIGTYIIKEKINIIGHTFRINLNKKSHYLNTDYCYFTNVEYCIEDYSLDIRNDIHIKSLNILNIERKEKIKKLNLL